MGCNYLSLPEIPASGNKVLISVKPTRYATRLAFTGNPCGAYCEYFGENWPLCNSNNSYSNWNKWITFQKWVSLLPTYWKGNNTTFLPNHCTQAASMTSDRTKSANQALIQNQTSVVRLIAGHFLCSVHKRQEKNVIEKNCDSIVSMLANSWGPFH